jgi:hypothetical protein
MTLDIDADAIEYIRKKGGACSIVETYPQQNSYAELAFPVTSFAAPERKTGYEIFERDGVSLYIDKRLHFKRDIVKVRLGRLLCFRWLEWPTMSRFGSYD